MGRKRNRLHPSPILLLSQDISLKDIRKKRKGKKRGNSVQPFLEEKRGRLLLS